MNRSFSDIVTFLDILALLWMLLAWGGYGWFTERSGRIGKGLLGISHLHRVEWAKQMLRRDVRVPDAALIGNLMQSVSFYASTTIYIIAGLLALLGTLDQVMLMAADLPFANASSKSVWEMKLLLLLGVFVIAYFKFTWSLRLFNLLSILIGGSPVGVTGEAEERAVNRFAQVNSLAGEEFNRGIRAYYFGIASVSWFLHPLLFMAMTTTVIVVLYRRDFASRALEVLSN